MSILTNMNGVPLFSTSSEAINWTITNDLHAYHKRDFQGKIGYMGGNNHSIAIKAIKIKENKI